MCNDFLKKDIISGLSCMKNQLDSLKIVFPYVSFHKKKEAIMASFSMILVSFLVLQTPYLMKFIIDEVLVNKNLRLLNLIILLLVGIHVTPL